MLEGFALTVEVCEEMLRAFGKVENGFEIDYLCAGRGDVGKGTAQEAEIAHVGHEVDGGIMDVFGHLVRIGLTVAGTFRSPAAYKFRYFYYKNNRKSMFSEVLGRK